MQSFIACYKSRGIITAVTYFNMSQYSSLYQMVWRLWREKIYTDSHIDTTLDSSAQKLICISYDKAWRYRPVVEHLTSAYEAWGSVLSFAKQNKAFVAL